MRRPSPASAFPPAGRDLIRACAPPPRSGPSLSCPQPSINPVGNTTPEPQENSQRNNARALDKHKSIVRSTARNKLIEREDARNGGSVAWHVVAGHFKSIAWRAPPWVPSWRFRRLRFGEVAMPGGRRGTGVGPAAGWRRR